MIDDKNISAADVRSLATRDGVAAFFAVLGYRTDSRQPQSAAAMGITAEALRSQIRHIERIAVHSDGAEPLDVYLVELTSVTLAATQGLARALRNRAGNYLLALTDDYERIDLVLLQRYLRGSSASPMMTQQVAVRPRVLTVHRMNATQVQLRVLRRFTYTEADSDAQYDKLLSAYTVAEWSEPLYNNRALFSDYYLNERLPELDEWKERPEEAYHRLRDLLTVARQSDDTGSAGTTTKSLVEPVLEALGFGVRAATGGEHPDYQLYATNDPGKPVALCLAYAWNRDLDGKDETRDTRTPDENPGARVVTVLESGEAPWVIVTNGKLWRLYSARTHSRSTNYYEIDLEETLAMADPNVAFRYFWLFFRLSAFVVEEVQRDGQARELSFLDVLLDESEGYAKRLGERLKDRVFEEVFPHFAEGFIEHLKGQVGLAGPRQASLLPIAEQLQLKREPDEEFRRQVFQGTLTLLYRLLFLLYAESRGLLPVKEERGYWERSLTKLKEDIAGKAGAIADEVRDQLRRAYGAGASDTGLYDRLLDLFSVIDRGRSELNVPHYSGGLFITKPDADDHTQEGETARFLAEHKIPDRYLALGLDLLARDPDDKRHDLVFIDYKSLGVRQLGSIYEGLLEFKVRIAEEKMAVVKGKKTEEVVPYGEALASKQKVLTVGRGRNALERVYQPGQIYLENDRKERRASGSYYTPDHIVKYIVENTVGPVLAEKLDNLRPKFREAQAAYKKAVTNADAIRKQGMKPDDPAKVANAYTGLVDDLFDLKVLDPAMGSGHFLVEAVDFICDRILGQREGFLRAFPWNPVTKHLQDTRDAIITEMDRQAVTVDTGRLTDINLLKRHVLKRCVYGVDLNPMAVELAKVSLWLDCFTIGAPLSFLDHHLKCGNSLIGTTAQEVQAELAKKTKGHVADLFGGSFQGLLMGTSAMLDIARSPDATVEQAEFSRSRFGDLESNQTPYKRALHIWVSQYFGNSRAQEYLTLTGTDLVEQLRPGGSGPPPEYCETVNGGTQIGRGKRFFHWGLEFPEAFVDLGHGRWNPKNEQGFDAVVGNPPYDELSEHAAGRKLPEKDFIANQPIYADARGGRMNVFRPFILRAVTLLATRGYHSFIVPMGLLADQFTKALRRRLLTESILRSVVAFPQKDDVWNRVFIEAKLSTCIYIIENRPDPSKPISIRVYPGRSFKDASTTYMLLVSEIANIDPESHSIPIMTALDIPRVEVVRACRRVTTWGAIAKCYLGELMMNAQNSHLTSSEPVGPRLLRGANINRYVLLPEPKQGEPLYLREEAFLREYAGDSRVDHHNILRLGFQESSPIDNWRRLIACIIPPEHYCAHTVRYFIEDSNYDIYTLLVLVNSAFSDWRFSLTSTNNHVNGYEINALPIPRFDRISIAVEGGACSNGELVTALYESNSIDTVAIWEAAVTDEIRKTPEDANAWPNSIHNALSVSGQELTRLRKSRQVLIEDFAEWLFTTLRIDHEKFMGRTHLQGSQADVDQQNWDWLQELLSKNRHTCGVDPSSKDTELRNRYEGLIAQAQQYNTKFNALDQATDRVIWQLVGLKSDGSAPGVER